MNHPNAQTHKHCSLKVLLFCGFEVDIIVPFVHSCIDCINEDYIRCIVSVWYGCIKTVYPWYQYTDSIIMIFASGVPMFSMLNWKFKFNEHFLCHLDFSFFLNKYSIKDYNSKKNYFFSIS